jgi:DNA-3-methyladenine glycosylase
MPISKLPLGFYRRSNVMAIARELLGMVLVTRFGGEQTSGRIVETEAYNGISDKAAHSWNGRRTQRTEIMYRDGGVAYIYLCYGLHQMFNVVTGKADVPKAVLVRALHPLTGLDIMLERRKKIVPDVRITRGPGSLAQAMGIHVRQTGMDLTGDEIFIGDDGYKVSPNNIICTPRIGVNYAGEDALLPYRFYIHGNEYVSR